MKTKNSNIWEAQAIVNVLCAYFKDKNNKVPNHWEMTDEDVYKQLLEVYKLLE